MFPACWKVSVPTWILPVVFVVFCSCFPGSFFGLSCFCVVLGCGSNHAVHVVLCRWGGLILFGGMTVVLQIGLCHSLCTMRLESACLTTWHMVLFQIFGNISRWNIAKRLSPKWSWDSTKMSRNSGSEAVPAPSSDHIQDWCPQYDPLAAGQPQSVSNVNAWNDIKLTMYVKGNQSTSYLFVFKHLDDLENLYQSWFCIAEGQCVAFCPATCTTQAWCGFRTGLVTQEFANPPKGISSSHGTKWFSSRLILMINSSMIYEI